MDCCSKHHDRPAQYYCSKHKIGLCAECISCGDPEIYCKFRSSCPIWFIHKERRREARRMQERNGNPE